MVDYVMTSEQYEKFRSASNCPSLADLTPRRDKNRDGAIYFEERIFSGGLGIKDSKQLYSPILQEKIGTVREYPGRNGGASIYVLSTDDETLKNTAEKSGAMSVSTKIHKMSSEEIEKMTQSGGSVFRRMTPATGKQFSEMRASLSVVLMPKEQLDRHISELEKAAAKAKPEERKGITEHISRIRQAEVTDYANEFGAKVKAVMFSPEFSTQIKALQFSLGAGEILAGKKAKL